MKRRVKIQGYRIRWEDGKHKRFDSRAKAVQALADSGKSGVVVRIKTNWNPETQYETKA